MAQLGKAGELHHIVESTFLAHKKDIHDYAGGHLNPEKLVKLPVKDALGTHKEWKSSRVGQRRENPYDRITQSKYVADDILIDKMKGALLDFSMGTVGTLPQTKQKKPKKGTRKKKKVSKTDSSPLRATRSEAKLETFVLSEIEKFMDDPDVFREKSKEKKKDSPAKTPRKKYVLSYGSKFPSVLNEELKLPELMLPSVDEAVRVPPSLKDPNPSSKQRIQELTDKKFFTTHLAGITRKDQFQKILDFDRNVLHRYETMEKNVRDGHKAASHLEQKLVRRLLEMSEHSKQAYSVNFERLQAYSEVWGDLCVDSQIFGTLLHQLKTEYDNYLSNLLDVMKATNHGELVTCLNATDGLTKYTEQDIEEIRGIVEGLEEEGRCCILKNAELHKSIKREKENIAEKERQRQLEEEENRQRLIPIKIPIKKLLKSERSLRPDSSKKEKNTEKKLQELRVQIWERLDSISQMQTELKTDYVPKTLHKNVQHAVQDTESEMQKLMQQIEYLSKNMKIQEDSLDNDLHRFDSSSKEALNDLLKNFDVS